MPSLRDGQRDDPLDLGLYFLACLSKIYSTLRVQLELGRSTEQARESECHLRTDCPAFTKKLVHALTRNAQCLRETSDGKLVVGQEIFPKHFTRVNGPNLLLPCIRNAHGSSRLSDSL